MCRHVAYVGSPITLAQLLLEPSHSLHQQSWNPRDMRGSGTINADGFGVGWYSDNHTNPSRYRRATPIWSDEGFAAFAHTVSAGALLAAVRSATPGMPVVETACAPFMDGPWLFSHNGVVHGWPDSMLPIAADLPIRDLLTLDAPTDSALVWAVVRHHLRTGMPPAQALRQTVNQISAIEPAARLNLLLTDGHTITASTHGHSLWVRTGTVASEPFGDSPDWEPVDNHQLVTVTRLSTKIEAI